MIRKLNVAALIDTFCPPHPAHVLSCGRGVEALLLAILAGHHALYKVGARLEERRMLPLLQDGLGRVSLNDYRLGQILEALFGANLNRVFGAIALNALDVSTLATPGSIRIRPRSACMGPMRRRSARLRGLSHPGLLMGTAKMGMMISSKSS